MKKPDFPNTASSPKGESSALELLVRGFFSAYGPLASSLAKRGGKDGSLAFEERPQQLSMALDVARSLANGSPLIVEAGPGVGKTLAYLVPAVFWIAQDEMFPETGRRMLVSTYTRTLQRQILEKDIPLLKEAFRETEGGTASRAEKILDSAIALYGSENYVCKRRLEQALASAVGALAHEKIRHEIALIKAWHDSPKNTDGLIAKMTTKVVSQAKALCVRDSNICSWDICQAYGICQYQRDRQRAADAYIVSINHALLARDLMRRPSRHFDRFQAVVIDEAHTFESVLLSAFGGALGIHSFQNAIVQICNPQRGFHGFLTRLDISSAVREGLHDEFKDLSRKVELAFTALGEVFPEKFTGTAMEIEQPLKIKSLAALESALEKTCDTMGSLNVHGDIFLELEGHRGLLRSVTDRFKKWRRQEGADLAYWIERGGVERRETTSIKMCSSATSLADYIPDRMLDKPKAVVFTSSTLTVGDSFDHFREATGLKKTEARVYDSPFDFPGRTLLYLETNLPSPVKDPEAYDEALVRRLKEIFQAAQGRTLVLFTSFQAMRSAHKRLQELYPGVDPYMQGQEEPYELLKAFEEDSTRPILATKTFWQGVDVVGENLIAIAICRLPFESPDQPLTAARLRRIEEEGGNGFRDHTLPQAVIMLRQAVGRLMRNKKSWGAICILDPRIETENYGKIFLKSLPNCFTTSSLERLKKFLSSEEPLRRGKGGG